MSFDEFLAKRGYIRGYKHDYQVAYDYGVASRQAEIDELQKRIDEALKILEGMRHNGAYRAIDALKGIKK